MTSLVLKKTLSQFNRSELETNVKKWPFIVENDISRQINWAGSTKYEVVGQITRICVKKKVTPEDIAELDLLYIQDHSGSKKWHVFQLEKVKGKLKKKTVVVAEELIDVLDESLGHLFDVVVSLRKHKDAFWLRFHFDAENDRFKSNDIIYMVYYPNTDYVVLTAMKQAHKDSILQALKVALGCKTVKQMKLSGKSVTSLFQLALNKDSQGSFSKFRLNQVDANPLSVRQKQKRKVPDEDDDDKMNEFATQKRRRTEILLDIFGPNEQPQLEKVEFTLETKFRGVKHAPGMRDRTDPFRCHVNFEGENVLEGIRNLAGTGILDIKMPSHLSNLHSMAKNHITLAEKEKTEDTEQEG